MAVLEDAFRPRTEPMVGDRQERLVFIFFKNFSVWDSFRFTEKLQI